MKGIEFFHFFCCGGSGTWILVLVHFTTIAWNTSPVVSSMSKDENGNSSSATENNTITEQCIDKTKESSEEFVMKLNLCRKNVSITCQIGGNSACHKDREAFKASAVISKAETKCLIEANTTELKYIRFVIKAKYLHNLNELGSRNLPQEVEIQRGRCTLGYSCLDSRYLKDIRVNCFAFHYDANESPFNGTSKKFVWDAPKDYEGSVFFRSLVKVSYTSFYVDVDTARIVLSSTEN